MIRKGLQDTSFDLSEFHFAYFFFHTQEDALGGTAGDCTLLADPDYMDVGGADACTMFALSKWTGAAAESLAPYPYEQLLYPIFKPGLPGCRPPSECPLCKRF